MSQQLTYLSTCNFWTSQETCHQQTRIKKLTFITVDVILWWLFLLLLLLLLFCSLRFGDWGFELGGEMMTFFPISTSTAAVSRCCCNWLRFFTLICGGASDGDVRVEDDCDCCFCVSNGITETELASKFCKWILLIREVTEDDFETGGDDVSLFLLLLLLLLQLLTVCCWWKFKWWLLLRNAVNAAIAVSSSVADGAAVDNLSLNGANRSSNLADDCRIISCFWRKRKNDGNQFWLLQVTLGSQRNPGNYSWLHFETSTRKASSLWMLNKL